MRLFAILCLCTCEIFGVWGAYLAWGWIAPAALLTLHLVGAYSAWEVRQGGEGSPIFAQMHERRDKSETRALLVTPFDGPGRYVLGIVKPAEKPWGLVIHAEPEEGSAAMGRIVLTFPELEEHLGVKMEVVPLLGAEERTEESDGVEATE